MSEQKWTKAQQTAIEDEGGALLVSAAAGSGKTAVLVERAVRLIAREDEPVDAARLLILTFTNAAAQELRSRIALRLEEEIRRQPAKAAQLRRQRLQLRRAFIGTIDAFCQQLVREHFAALDLPPDIAIGDEAQLAQLREAALADTMEEMYADEDFAGFAALYDKARSDAVAERAVLELAFDVDVLPNPAGQLRAFAGWYDTALPLEKTVWGKQLLHRAADALAEGRAMMHEAVRLAEEEPAMAPYLPAVQYDAAFLEMLADLVQAGQWDDVLQALQGYAQQRLGAVKGHEERKAQIKYLRKNVKTKIIDSELRKYCFTCTRQDFVRDRDEAAPLVAALCRAAALFRETYDAAKHEERVLDHADFEHLALALLRGEDGARTPLAEKISARYAQVFVDEYQDTNELQSALYESLAAKDGGNLFYVGDVKQSIYRFRKANPGIFLQKKEAWAEAGTGRHPCKVDLGHNFRSAPGVIDAVNDVFTRLMSPQLGEVRYDEGERLICGREHAVHGGFSVDILDGGDAKEEAALVARRIARMVEDKEPVADGDGTRPCGYGDFCILLRARGKMPAFAAALEDAGIPVMADFAESLLDTPEVLPLVAALSAIDNPGDDVMLAAAMLGPLFRFSPDEMARLRAAAPRGRLWGAVVLDEDEKTKTFVELMAYYRALAGQVPVGRLCEELVNSTGYLSAVAAMEGGAARRDNLLRFIGWAAGVGESGRGGLAGFVRLLANKNGPQPPAARQLPGHVSLLTIHKSKGLEFPFVFLCDASHPFRVTNYASRVQMHAELGVGLLLRAGDVLYPTLPAAAIRGRVVAEEKSEEMRLLYVALTRAKQQVFVTFCQPKAQRFLENTAAAAQCASPFSLGMAQNMAVWLMTAVLQHTDGMALLKERGLAAGMPGKEEGRFAVQIHETEEAQAVQRAPYRLTAAPDETARDALLQVFARVPQRMELFSVPAKLSVSAIAKEEGVSLRRRPSFMYGAGLSAAERGTAQHAFMQYADFTAAAKDVAAEVDRLWREGFIEEATAKAVDADGVRAFLASELYARMQNAGRVLREYDFITAVPAGSLQPDLPKELAGEPVLVQGIADVVLVFSDHVEIVDYKTDRNVTKEELAARYETQLALYQNAIEKRLGLPVVKRTIWSFALAREVDV